MKYNTTEKKYKERLGFSERGTLQAPQYITNIKENIFPSLPQM